MALGLNWGKFPTWVALAWAAWGCQPPDVPAEAAFRPCQHKSCDDGNPCTQDHCDDLAGCAHLPLDATPCPDQGPCLARSACQAGVCVGRARLWELVAPVLPNGADFATAMTGEAGGDLVVVGNMAQDGPTGKQRDNFLLRVPAEPATGAPQPVAVTLQADPANDDELSGLTALANGTLLAVGIRRELASPIVTDPTTWARWIVIRPPKDTPEPFHLGIAGRHGFYGVARAGDGSALAVGFVDKTGLAMRFLPDGNQGIKRAVPGPKPGTARLRAVVGLPPQTPTWIAVGDIVDGSGHWSGWAARLAGAGTETTWSAELPVVPGQFGEMYAAVAMPDQGVVALGAVAPTAPPTESPMGAKLWMVRLGANGAVLWSFMGAKLQAAPGVLMRSSVAPRLMVTSTQDPLASQPGKSLAIFDFDGNPLGSSALADGVALAAVAFPDGSLGLAGVRADAGQNDTWLARSDPWGHVSCQSAGQCVSAMPGACLDGNSCTIDTCAANSGCAHAPGPTGATCGQDRTCKDTTCISSTGK